MVPTAPALAGLAVEPHCRAKWKMSRRSGIFREKEEGKEEKGAQQVPGSREGVEAGGARGKGEDEETAGWGTVPPAWPLCAPPLAGGGQLWLRQGSCYTGTVSSERVPAPEAHGHDLGPGSDL